MLNYKSGTSFSGQQFDLNAIANQGWKFQEWTGDIQSTENPLTITVSSDLNITAKFVQESLSIDDNTLKNSFVVYPNPSSNGVFTIKNHTKENWEIYNVNGAKILSGKGDIIDVSSFSKGLYILKLENTYKKLIYN